MTATVQTTPASFFDQALERIAAFAREQTTRRARRVALMTLMDMDASRLDDLGLEVQDVVEALSAPPPAARILESRRAARAAAWTPFSATRDS